MTVDGLIPLGALVQDGGVLFRVWAPRARRLEIILEPQDEAFECDARSGGYFEAFLAGVEAGQRYRIRMDDGPLFPDPASRFQPEGVHGPSQVIDAGDFTWRARNWLPIDQRELVFYELHVGTFSPEGTFEGVRSKLPHLRDLGVNAIELMPVADFPGRWNWGYDHASLYAPSRAYGTPDDLRQLVDEAHMMGIAVYLDVIYNHLGPDGAYAAAFAPFFTENHQTPWGAAVNLDDTDNEGVRNFFLDNAIYWLREFRLDGFRLDATHALIDDSGFHFLAQLAEMVERLSKQSGHRRLLFAEDHRNLNRIVLPRKESGYGLHGVWVDDFHHLVRNITAGDTAGYYADFAGASASEIAETLLKGWFYDGKMSLAKNEARGTPTDGVRLEQCVYCIQNHDQVGNRPLGDRLNHVISPAAYRAASALLLFPPQLPLLFQGQEWAATTPFQFFTDHNAELGKLVSEGRRKEFEDFPDFAGEVPDPQDPGTFNRSRLNWYEAQERPHAATLDLYRELIALRRRLGNAFSAVAMDEKVLYMQRGRFHLIVALGPGDAEVPEGVSTVLTTEDERFAGADGRPPHIAEGLITFEGPCAVMLEETAPQDA
jgi:maltooligosyltrehalose trehalohydrolase